MPEVNPAILHWARETAGLAPEVAARKLSIGDAYGVAAADRLAAMERGEAAPSRSLLRRMAAQYRRPLVTFYLADVPRKGDRGEDFRTLPEQHDPGEDALLDTLLRDLKARQGLLRAAMEDDEDIESLPFIGAATRAMGVPAVATAIRDTIGFSLTDFRAAPDPIAAFKALRTRIEAAGIYVLLVRNLGSYHTNISVETFRGVALADEIVPFVVINAGDAKTAWSFTLLHELAHLWLGASGVSGPTSSESGIERFCNDVASELLAPQSELAAIELPADWAIEEVAAAINEFAQARNISRTMVAYKLYRAGRVDYGQWTELRDHFRGLWTRERELQRQRQAEGESGPDANVLARARLGWGLLATTKRLLRAGALSTTKAGRVLGVKPTRVGNILELSGAVGRQS